MTSVIFIADGYTQPGYVQPVEPLHNALRFRFRPVLSDQGTLAPGDRDALHVEVVRLFQAMPSKFIGSQHRQTIEHLRYLQRAVILARCPG
jgi:hypothetical protein